jgi:prepilin-type N-terminal cleavage/methylation domain-containing protein
MFQLSRKGAVAFSLIEILVAIAIIGVLATLAVNWLGASSAKSKEVKCLNNLKQLGAATQLYCAENMGALPLRGSTPYNSPPWYQPLVSYVSANMKNGSQIAIENAGIKTFQCPAYKPPPARDVTYAPDVKCANLSMISITQPSKKIWKLLSPFWRSEEKWTARLLLLSVVALTLGLVYLNVLFNEWNRDFYNALETKNLDEFWAQLWRFSWLAFIYIAVAIYKIYITQAL